LETGEGKELERLITEGDYRSARQFASTVVASADAPDKARTEAKHILRGLKPDPVALVLIGLTALGILLVFLSYAG